MRARLAASVALIVMAGSLVAPATAEGSFPGPATWRAAGASGESVAVRLGGSEVLVTVEQNRRLFAPGAQVLGLDGEPTRGDVLALAGWVEGSSGSWVRLTVTDRVVLGTIVAPGVGAFAVGMAEDGPLAVAGGEIARRLRDAGIDTVIEPQEVQQAEQCDSLMWVPQLASPLTLVEGSELRTFDVAFAVDEAFVDTHPGDWDALATSFINSIDGLFRASFDIGLSVVHLIAIPGESLPSTTTSGLLDELQLYYRAHYENLPRDDAHLFTGKETTNAAGQVNCVGSAGRTTVSYSVGQGDPGGNFVFGPLILLPDGAFKISAHELAHTLSDHHHYSNCAETLPAYDPIFTLDVCTVMINDWGLIHPTFSTVDRLTVRGWADHYDI